MRKEFQRLNGMAAIIFLYMFYVASAAVKTSTDMLFKYTNVLFKKSLERGKVPRE